MKEVEVLEVHKPSKLQRIKSRFKRLREKGRRGSDSTFDKDSP